jgi:hypothetical protein
VRGDRLAGDIERDVGAFAALEEAAEVPVRVGRRHVDEPAGGVVLLLLADDALVDGDVAPDP